MNTQHETVAEMEQGAMEPFLPVFDDAYWQNNDVRLMVGEAFGLGVPTDAQTPSSSRLKWELFGWRPAMNLRRVVSLDSGSVFRAEDYEPGTVLQSTLEALARTTVRRNITTQTDLMMEHSHGFEVARVEPDGSAVNYYQGRAWHIIQNYRDTKLAVPIEVDAAAEKTYQITRAQISAIKPPKFASPDTHTFGKFAYKGWCLGATVESEVAAERLSGIRERTVNHRFRTTTTYLPVHPPKPESGGTPSRPKFERAKFKPPLLNF
jgi:hypothetical protein